VGVDVGSLLHYSRASEDKKKPEKYVLLAVKTSDLAFVEKLVLI
jgi:hypothetical protein